MAKVVCLEFEKPTKFGTIFENFQRLLIGKGGGI